MTQPFFFERAELMTLAKESAAAYRSADPFPHAVFDDFLPTPVLDGLIEAFPGPKDAAFRFFDDAMQRKLASPSEEQLAPAIRQILGQFNSAAFVDFIEELTGIEGLISDHHFEGGGAHQILPGGLLKLHVDFNRHPRLDLDRRVNALIYLNEDWDEAWGGHLELWDRDVSRCGNRVAPIANRLVVFTTTDFSFHGHPDPLACPEGMSRKSLALYYYSNGRPAEELSGTAARGTQFKRRPGERIRPSLHEVAQQMLPPALLHAVEKLRSGR